MRYFTSDLHLGHAGAKGGVEPGGILAYCPNRPYEDLDEMNQGLINNILAVVSPTDELVFLGDVAMGNRERNLAYLEQIPCFKTLVPGNHDHCWAGSKNAEKWRPIYEQFFDRIIDDDRHLVDTVGGHDVTISHFPPDGDHDGTDDRYPQYRPFDQGRFVLHGHLHGVYRMRGRRVDVGVDAWGGWPVSEAELGAILDDGPRDLEPLEWVRA